MILRAAAALLLAVCAAAAQPEELARRVDAAAEGPEGRLRVATAVGERLGMHRNRVALLRRQTGAGYGRIFIDTLRERGASEERIERELRGLLAELEGVAPARPGIGPVLTIRTGIDRSSVATYYSVAPEVGVENRHAGVVLGAPLYSLSAGGESFLGVGDVYAAGWVRGRAARLDLSAGLSVGFPTGDEDAGLGAGKTSVDGRFTAAYRLERGRVFGSVGGSNFLFNNFVYQRPYISSGPAAHFSGGGEVYPVRRIAVGMGLFAVQPSGVQELSTAPAPEPWRPPGRGAGTPQPPGQSARVAVPAADLADRGINGWAAVALSRQVWLEAAVARSFPFNLTTARVWLVFYIFGTGR